MTNMHLTVAAVVERHNRFLFVEELVRGEEVINQPAGHVEPGEPFFDAVVREMLEETAWEFIPSAIIGLYLWVHPTSGDRFVRAVYTGKLGEHDPKRELDDGILRAVWLSREDLLARTQQLRSPMVIRAVDDYLAGTRFPVTMFQHTGFDELAERAQLVSN
jgi:8-oxo-dGTP pyrophosphatase MutT (NUDIX family)